MRSHFIYNLEKIKDKIIKIRVNYHEFVSFVFAQQISNSFALKRNIFFNMLLSWVKEEQWTRPS